MLTFQHRNADLENIKLFLSSARRLWATEGYDAAQKLFVEGITPDGNVQHTGQHRLRVQLRQIYVFAQAYAETDQDVYLRMCKETFEEIRALYKHPTIPGAYVSFVDDALKITDTHVYAYEMAFFIFAAAWLYNICEDPAYLHDIEAAYAVIEQHLEDPQTHLIHSAYPYEAADCYEQNPHMHLLEALLFAFVFSGDPVYLAHSGKLYLSVAKHFFDPEHDVIRETIAPDLAYNAQSEKVEPGHLGEWVWLLMLFGAFSGESTFDLMRALYTKLTACGIDAESHFAYGAVTPDGTCTDANKRLWIQCEVLKAHMSMYRVEHDETYLQAAKTLCNAIFEDYVNAEKGLWKEHLTPDGRDLYTYAPATTLYHLNGAFQMACMIFEPPTPCSGCSGCSHGGEGGCSGSCSHGEESSCAHDGDNCHA